jgi:hypothetical protein
MPSAAYLNRILYGVKLNHNYGVPSKRSRKQSHLITSSIALLFVRSESRQGDRCGPSHHHVQIALERPYIIALLDAKCVERKFDPFTISLSKERQSMGERRRGAIRRQQNGNKGRQMTETIETKKTTLRLTGATSLPSMTTPIAQATPITLQSI